MTLYSNDRPTDRPRVCDRQAKTEEPTDRVLAGAAVSGSVLSRLPFFRPKATAGSEASAAARAVSVGVVARQPTEGGVASAAAAAPPARSTEGRTSRRTRTEAETGCSWFSTFSPPSLSSAPHAFNHSLSSPPEFLPPSLPHMHTSTSYMTSPHQPIATVM